MKQRIAEALRSMANRLDPPPPIDIRIPPQIRLNLPVISPEQAARIGKRMAEIMKTAPKINVPAFPNPPSVFDRLLGYPGGMPTGSCGRPGSAAAHKPHVTETDGREMWCVGGYVEAGR